MAKREIIWSDKAKVKLYEILEFYIERNKSKTYSIKLYKKIVKDIKLIVKMPNIGIKTDLESVRGLIVENFIIFYEYDADNITILTIWDSRQDPDNLIIK
ncbi:MAG: type II toxin-antitoxin system RelE/ParE family toxin [Candidatus Delongbacteria bacterium]|nr:type II toxin-antitoxin system RelE/ParE family toxin [Candidatus Delongbacteria bacterium]MCG2760762.1 type II toxin-antitoxin system RelE/ParE family toxin [Candidatus Delongbacteria bacterium]